MNIRTSILGALAMLALTCCCAAPESDSDMETTAASDTNEVVADTCDSGPMAPLVAAPEDVAGIVAAVLPPFDATTTCEVVTARLYLNDDIAPCEPPDAVDIVSFDVDMDNLGAPPALHTVAPLPAQGTWVATEEPNIYEVRWQIQTSHAADMTPLVGVVVRSNLCPITRPVCDGQEAVRYRTTGAWSPIAGLYFGLADCHQTFP